jgi:hypothetical protein
MIVGIVALVCGSVSALLATFTNFEIIDKVNEKLPDSEKFDLLGWYLPKTQNLRTRFRTFYPDGRLLTRVRTITVVMFVCFFIVAWGFGLFAR